MKKLTKDELLEYRDSGYLTWGELKEWALKNNIPDEAIVVVERVEDFYYDKNNWSVYCKENSLCSNLRRINGDIAAGAIELKQPFTEEQVNDARSEYHPVWSPVYYSEDPNILFLDLHY